MSLTTGNSGSYKYVWNFEKSEKTLIIDWNIFCKVCGSPKRKFCPFRFKEKLVMTDYPNKNYLINLLNLSINAAMKIKS